MTAETDLLPLPEGDAAWYYIGSTYVYSADEMESYARANVAHATAPLQAEVEALRAEVERVTCELMDATTRADKLAEALRLALDSHGVMLMTDPPQDAWKVHRVEEIGRALLRDQEEGHEQ